MAITDEPFCLPVKRLENERVILQPFDFSVHLDPYLEGCKNHPELYNYVGYGPIVTEADFTQFYESRISSSSDTLFAVLAKSDEADEHGTLAGVIGYQCASPAHASVEIGYVRFSPIAASVTDS